MVPKIIHYAAESTESSTLESLLGHASTITEVHVFDHHKPMLPCSRTVYVTEARCGCHVCHWSRCLDILYPDFRNEASCPAIACDPQHKCMQLPLVCSKSNAHSTTGMVDFLHTHCNDSRPL